MWIFFFFFFFFLRVFWLLNLFCITNHVYIFLIFFFFFFFVVNLIRESKLSPKRSVSMVTDLQQVDILCSRIQGMLSVVLQYVEDVLVSFCYDMV